MAIDNVASASTALRSIQTSQSQQDVNLGRLATGRSVNSASDNAQAFVLAQGLLERSTNLSQVGQGIGQDIGALQAASAGLDAISKVVGQLKAVAQQALSSQDPAQQTQLQAQYNALAGQIDSLAADSSYNGVNLIAPGGAGASASGNFISSRPADSASLGVTAAGGWQGNASAIQADLNRLDQATQTLRGQSAELGANVTQLQTQAGFVQSQSAIAQQGAARLTGADIRESAANAQAANTYRQLGQAALRNSAQGQDALLGLFTGGR